MHKKIAEFHAKIAKSKFEEACKIALEVMGELIDQNQEIEKVNKIDKQRYKDLLDCHNYFINKPIYAEVERLKAALSEATRGYKNAIGYFETWGMIVEKTSKENALAILNEALEKLQKIN